MVLSVNISSADRGGVYHPWCPEDGFGKAVVARGMPKPCDFPSLDSCQKGLLWIVDITPHQSLVLCST